MAVGAVEAEATVAAEALVTVEEVTIIVTARNLTARKTRVTR